MINLALSFYSAFLSKTQYVFEMSSKDAFSSPPLHSCHLHTQCSRDTDTQNRYIWYFYTSLHVGVLAKCSISVGEWMSQSIL